MGTVKVNGEALKTIRTRTGLSLRQLAGESGVSFRYIAYLEEGRYSPSFAIVEKLARALRILPTALLADPNDVAPEEEVAVS